MAMFFSSKDGAGASMVYRATARDQAGRNRTSIVASMTPPLITSGTPMKATVNIGRKTPIILARIECVDAMFVSPQGMTRMR
jgi:hypothetical protein